MIDCNTKETIQHRLRKYYKKNVPLPELFAQQVKAAIKTRPFKSIDPKKKIGETKVKYKIIHNFILLKYNLIYFRFQIYLMQ